MHLAPTAQSSYLGKLGLPISYQWMQSSDILLDTSTYYLHPPDFILLRHVLHQSSTRLPRVFGHMSESTPMDRACHTEPMSADMPGSHGSSLLPIRPLDASSGSIDAPVGPHHAKDADQQDPKDKVFMTYELCTEVRNLYSLF